MEKYLVFFQKIKIGELEVNKEGMYRYTSIEENVQKIRDMLILPVDLSCSTGWVEPIPFFKNRIENSNRFKKGDKEIIGYLTDDYRLVPVVPKN